MPPPTRPTSQDTPPPSSRTRGPRRGVARAPTPGPFPTLPIGRGTTFEAAFSFDQDYPAWLDGGFPSILAPQQDDGAQGVLANDTSVAVDQDLGHLLHMHGDRIRQQSVESPVCDELPSVTNWMVLGSSQRLVDYAYLPMSYAYSIQSDFRTVHRIPGASVLPPCGNQPI